MTRLQVDRDARVFVLTGAGISAESGIRTFRDAGGLWEDHDVMQVASPEGFAADPVLVWRFYSERRLQVREALPNAAHHALTALQRHLGDGLTLCTQNVDPLHEAAGSRDVLHMHGELGKTRCANVACHRPPFVDDSLHLPPGPLPRCDCGALLRPHIVWFGEVPLGMPTIKRQVQRCDLFVTVGSSGSVYPAAGLVREIRDRQAMGEAVRSVYVGLDRPDNAAEFDDIRLGPAGEILPELFALHG